jgi:hypothetical protein
LAVSPLPLKNDGAAVDDVIVCRHIYSTVHFRYNQEPSFIGSYSLVIVAFGIIAVVEYC